MKPEHAEIVERLRNAALSARNGPAQVSFDARFVMHTYTLIESLAARLEAIENARPVTGYSITDDSEYGFSDPDDLGEHASWAGGDVGSVYELTPWRPDPSEFYGIVPVALVSAREWVDGDYSSGTFDVIGPFKTREEAKQAADECTKERKAEWEADQ